MAFVRTQSLRRQQKTDKLPPGTSSNSTNPTNTVADNLCSSSSSIYNTPPQLQRPVSSIPAVYSNNSSLSMEIPPEQSHDSVDCEQTVQTSQHLPIGDNCRSDGVGFRVADGDTTMSGVCHHRDFVVLVPTPRTSSPIPKPSGDEERTPTNVLEEGSGMTKRSRTMQHDARDSQVGKTTDGRRPSPKRGRLGVDLHLHKTVGRLKQYFGISVGGCHASSSGAAAEDVERKPFTKPVAYAGPKDAVESDRKGSKVELRRKRSRSDPVDPVTIIHQNSRHQGHHPRRESKSGMTSMATTQGTTNHPGLAENGNMGKHAATKSSTHRSRSKAMRGGDGTDMAAVPTVVPGVCVRVPTAPSSRHSNSSSHHHRHRHHGRHASINLVDDYDDNSHQLAMTAMTMMHGISAIAPPSRSISRSSSEAAQYRSNQNVERWLAYNRQLQSRSSTRSSHRRRYPNNTSRHARNELGVQANSDLLRRADRSASESDLRRTDRHHSRRSFRNSLRASESSPVRPRAGSLSVAATLNAGESRLGPSLLQFVADIIEDLEKNAKDDDDGEQSSGDWLKTPRTANRNRFKSAATPMSRLVDHLVSKTPGGMAKDKGGNTPGKYPDSNGSGSKPAVKSDLSNVGTNIQDQEVPVCSVAALRQRLLQAVEGKSATLSDVTPTTPGKSNATLAGCNQERKLVPLAYSAAKTSGDVNVNAEQLHELGGRSIEVILNDVKSQLQQSNNLSSCGFDALERIIHLQSSEIVRLKAELDTERHLRCEAENQLRAKCGGSGTIDKPLCCQPSVEQS